MARFSVKKFNKQRLFNIDTEGFEYHSLEQVYKAEDSHPTIYRVRGLYINKSTLYEPAPLAALDDFYINLPAHMTDEVREMLDDRLAIQAINNGEVGIKIYTYFQKRYNKTCYSVEWVDCDPLPVINDEEDFRPIDDSALPFE